MTNLPQAARLQSLRGRLSIAALAIGAIAGVALSLPAHAADDTLPGGDWSRFCTEARMSGSDLQATCRRPDGSLVRVEANVQGCGGAVAYDPAQAKFYCGYRDSQGYRPGDAGYRDNQGNYRPGEVGYPNGQPYRAGDPAYRGSEWFPAGQWRERCNDAQMDGDMLKANCLRSDGAYRYTEYNARECQGRPIVYSIRDGQFSCGGYSQVNGSGHFPSGAWGESCNNASMRNSVLRAQCQTNSGQMMSTQVDTNKCPRGVWNNNGQLTCQ